MPEAAPKKAKAHNPPPELIRAEAKYMLSLRQITRTIGKSTAKHVTSQMAKLVGDGGPGAATRIRRASAQVVADTKREHPAREADQRISEQLEEITRASGELFVGGLAEDVGMSPSKAHELALLGFDVLDGDADMDDAVKRTGGELDEFAFAMTAAKGLRSETKRANSRFRKDNRALIKDLPVKHSKDMSRLLIEGVAAGLTLAAMRLLSRDRVGITGRRGDTIAQDQTQKGQGDQQRDRQRSAGIDGYFWKDQGDNDVRELHAELGASNEIHKWKDPPPDPDGHPGEPAQCRCFAVPAASQAILAFASGNEAEGFKAARGERALSR